MIQVAGRMDQIILVGQTLRFSSPTVLHVIKHLSLAAQVVHPGNWNLK
jgi:hypothetical protein